MAAAQGELRALLHQPRFNRLLATRLTSQACDGIFQTSLAGAVLFNPDHHTGASKVAVGLVVLLLPYSLIGPFAGVLLDRWRRQQILTRGAVIRAALVVVAAVLLATRGPSDAGFAIAALGVLAVNRFYLAALSAALPHVVMDQDLVLANALSPTAGTVMTIVGGGVGLAVRSLAGSGDHGNAIVALVAATGYLIAATISGRLPADSLGPDVDTKSLGAGLAVVARGLAGGAAHLWARRRASVALGMIIGQRFLFGLWTIMALLLYRNTFHDHGVLRAGLVGAGQAATAGGIGLVLGAAASPRATARFGMTRWVVAVTATMAGTEIALGAPFSMSLLLVSAVALGFATQATKVCVDTTVQESVEDEFRGRAFAIYDTVYNVSFVAAAAVAAFALPASGKSLPTLAAMSAAYLALAVGYAAMSRSAGRAESEATEQATEQAR
jgi:MFS family permease